MQVTMWISLANNFIQHTVILNIYKYVCVCMDTHTKTQKSVESFLQEVYLAKNIRQSNGGFILDEPFLLVG